MLEYKISVNNEGEQTNVEASGSEVKFNYDELFYLTLTLLHKGELFLEQLNPEDRDAIRNMLKTGYMNKIAINA